MTPVGFTRGSRLRGNLCEYAVLQTPRLASARPGSVDRLIHKTYCQAVESRATFEKSAFESVFKVQTIESS